MKNVNFDVAAFDSALAVIVNSEAAIRDAVNVWGPEVISAITGGNNIVHANKLAGAFTGIRKARVIAILKRFLPYDFDGETDQFTTKTKNKKLADKKAEAFTNFLQSGATFWELMEEKKAADKKPVDNLAKLKKAAAAAAADGIDFDTMLAVITLAIREAAAAEEMAEAA